MALTPELNYTERRMDRLLLKEAAQRLNITPDALRQRIRRGQYRSEKVDNRVYVWIDEDRTETEPNTAADLIEVLRSQLEAERQANVENRRIIAALTTRQIEPPKPSYLIPTAVGLISLVLIALVLWLAGVGTF